MPETQPIDTHDIVSCSRVSGNRYSVTIWTIDRVPTTIKICDSLEQAIILREAIATAVVSWR